MKAAEAAGESGDSRLRPGDPARPNSFKVRRGRVGGYRDDLGPESIAYVDAAVARLDPFYGYGPTAALTPAAEAPSARQLSSSWRATMRQPLFRPPLGRYTGARPPSPRCRYTALAGEDWSAPWC